MKSKFNISALNFCLRNNPNLEQQRSIKIFIIKRRELEEKEIINFEGEKKGTRPGEFWRNSSVAENTTGSARCPVHEHNAEDQTHEKGLDIDGDGGPGRRRHGVKATSCVHSFPPSFPSSRSTSLDIDHPYWESEFGICFFHLSGLSSLTDDLSRQSSKSVLFLRLCLSLSLSSFSLCELHPLLFPFTPSFPLSLRFFFLLFPKISRRSIHHSGFTRQRA